MEITILLFGLLVWGLIKTYNLVKPTEIEMWQIVAPPVFGSVWDVENDYFWHYRGSLPEKTGSANFAPRECRNAALGRLVAITPRVRGLRRSSHGANRNPCYHTYH